MLVDGKSVGAAASYTIENVQAAHTITAQFRLKDNGQGGNEDGNQDDGKLPGGDGGNTAAGDDKNQGGSQNAAGQDKAEAVQTGDTTNLLMPFGMMLLAACTAAAAAATKVRKNK